MIEDRKFEKAYLQSLKELDAAAAENPGMRLGDRLFYILRDFVTNLTDWSREEKITSIAAELYKRTWASCRNFILPMNPQRTELDYAVRKILLSLGVQLKQRKPRKVQPKN